MKKRFIGLCCVIALFTLQSVTVLAAPTVTSDDTNYTVEGQDGDSAQQEVEVTVSKGSTFTVCVPKRIDVQPDTEVSYSVGIFADIAADQKIVVEPMDTTGDGDDEINFILENEVNDGITAKSDIKAKIIPIKTEWNYGDSDFIADYDEVNNPMNHVESGKIKASVTAGSWSGKFTLRIALEDV